MVGDALTDLAAARRAGVRPALVLTGRGRHQLAMARPDDLDGVLVAPTLAALAHRLVARAEGGG
jgi:histidinol phosphatase-like enzyme